MEFQTYWTSAFLVIAALVFVLIIGLGLKKAGTTKLKNFIASFDKDFPKNSIIPDHALVRFEEHRYNHAEWEVYNAVRVAVTLSLCFVGLALSPYIGGMIETLDGSFRLMIVLGIAVFIVIGCPQIAESWFKKHRFNEELYQKPQWDRMQKVADRYGITLVRSGGYRKNLTHIRTSIEATAFNSVSKNKGTAEQ